MSTATGFNSSGALGTVKSVGLTMPDAFTVDNSPITESGDISVTLEGSASQYVRGDGQLAQLPIISGGGGGQVYYLNGGTSQGTIGGSEFKQLSPAATIGTGVDFTSTTADNNDFVNFITDIGTPDQETVPAGVWIFQCYLSSTASTSKIYAEVQVWNGTSFTTLGTSIAETITNGTTVDLYTFTVAIPEYNPLVPADRIAIRFYSLNLLGVNTITLHTQNSHLGSIQTTFTTGLSALNGLTKSAQYLSAGTAGTDFAISSATDTHTFNLPTASATKRGALSSADWTTFNNKQAALGFTPENVSNKSDSYTASSSTTYSSTKALVDGLATKGTVTSVAALTLGTTGTDLGSTVANGTTTPVITLNVPTASATNRGALSSTDWSTFNGKQNTISLTTTGTSGAATLVGSTLNVPNYASVPVIPQANKIYVDSINGTDSTGRGNINTPYLTVEYALADITNTGTVTATTTNASATLTAVSSTTNIVVGQYITGTGIPYNTTVVSKTSNTIVLSKTCTASATITATWWTPYLIVLNGDFVATGNWQKQGFTFQCFNSTISWGAFNLFNLSTAQLVPFIVLGGNWNGTSSSSRFLSLAGPSSADFVFKPNVFYSIGTGYSIDSNQNGVYKFNNFTLECQDYICAFGSIASFESIGNVNVIGYFYSLLTGFLLRYCTFDVFGKIESPSSVNIINNTQGATITSNAIIKGSLASVYGVFNGNINGTTLTNTGGSYVTPATYNCGVTVTTFTNSGFAIINGQMLGNVVNNGTLGNIIINDMIGTYTGSSTSKGTVRASSDVGVTFQATLTGSAELTVLDTRYMINAVTVYTIASGCTLYNKGYFRGYLGTMAGTLINEGNMTMIDISIITGTFKNFNYINLTRSGTESASATPTISVSTGTLILSGRSQLECQLADSKSGLIRKTASGGKVVILGQPYLKVANGLAPLQILSNTGTAQDVLNFGVVDNCAAGFRLANTFSDTTYGTAYAPNILGGGTNYEDTTYSF